MKRRMISNAQWKRLEVGRDVTLLSRDKTFPHRLDHAGYALPNSSQYSGFVVFVRPDYVVLQDTESFVVRRDEIAAVAVNR